jgi:GTP cyclohydrolase II
MVLYLRQEGRGIGLLNKLKAYALQEQGLDTVEANHSLGFPDDLRTYDCAVEMLKFFGITKVKLLTNNPRKIGALESAGIEVERERHQLASIYALPEDRGPKSGTCWISRKRRFRELSAVNIGCQLKMVEPTLADS